jgi:hypothetical protein
MAEPFSVVKALDITPSALGKSVSVVLKGLLVIALVAGLGWGIYVTMVKPHTNPTPSSTTNQEGTITNNYINPTADELQDIINSQIKKQKPKFFLGVRLLGFDIGIQK